VKKVIFASSNHVIGLYEQDEPYRSIVAGRYEGTTPSNIPQIDRVMPIRPDGYYGISKAFGEALGRYYAEKYNIQVFCLRIGTVNRDNRPRNVREYATFLTHQDLVSLIEECLNNQNIKFEIFYGVSSNKWKF
jgi:uronate dehydrogenase